MERNSAKQLSLLCTVIALIFSMGGCYGGSRGILRFDDLKYPASMSPYLYGPNDELLAKDRDLIALKHFRFEDIHAAIFYSLFPLQQTHDPGDRINAEIEQAGGDAAVNVKITSKTGPTTYLHPLTLLPFWPSYTTIIIEGDIVKYQPSPAESPRKTAPFDIPDTVLIIDASDDSMTVRLQESCRVAGTIDTLFAEDSFWQWQPNAQSWKTFRPADGQGSGEKETMLDRVKAATRERGANVAKILFVSLDQHDVEKRSEGAPVRLSLLRSAALDIQYWACPQKKPLDLR